MLENEFQSLFTNPQRINIFKLHSYNKIITCIYLLAIRDYRKLQCKYIKIFFRSFINIIYLWQYIHLNFVCSFFLPSKSKYIVIQHKRSKSKLKIRIIYRNDVNCYKKKVGELDKFRNNEGTQ